MRRYVEWMIRYRLLVMVLTLIVSGALAFQIKNLKIVIDPNTNLPQDHPYVMATNQVEKLFGSKNVVVIGITPKQGTAYQPDVLTKIQRITTALLDTPGILKENTLSLSAHRAKKILGTADGMEVRPLMETVPQTPGEIEALRQTVRGNPVYSGVIISKDERTAAIIAEYKDPKNGYETVMENVRAIVNRERDNTIDIAVGGWPVYGARLERYSQRMAFLFPLAVLITGLIHYEAFRTVQGLILPLVTALLAVVWGVGIMGASGVPMDAFNASTPILILAVAAGHAVQILKRYYEEYHRLRAGAYGYAPMSPQEANRAAVVESITRIGPVMLTAGIVAALGFFSLFVFKMTVIRTFGIFTGLGILSALVLEMTFIPALRSFLPAPKPREEHLERERRIWERFTETIARWVTGSTRPKEGDGEQTHAGKGSHLEWYFYRVYRSITERDHRKRIYAGTLVLVLLWIVGAGRVKMENSNKSYFFQNLPFQQEDRILNDQLGGTNTLYVLVEGTAEDAIKQPDVLQAMEATQKFLEQQPYVGKTLSLADFVKRMNQAMHSDDPAYNVIPDSRDLISQYLLLYSMSGEPEDFDSYVDYGYQSANIWVFLKTDNSIYLQELIAKLNNFLPAHFGNNIRVRIGGGAPVGAAMNEVMVHGKILNILQISGVIFLIASLVFKSVVAGLLVLVPLSLAVLGNFGLMGLLGIRLNIATSVISAMAVGIGADYAIYLMYRIREELSYEADETKAFRIALTTAGKATLFVASAIAGGYAVLLFSWGFNIHIWFGFLTASAMLVSALSALILLPSLILTFRPRFIFGKAREGLMPTTEVSAAILLTFALGLQPGSVRGADLTAEEIMKKNFVSTKVLDSVSDATFRLINKNGQERVRKTFGTTKLEPNGVDNMRMVRFLSPPDVKGTVTLLIEHSGKDDDIWIYLPALKKVRRLVSSNKKDSFVGTDFTYEDVIGQKVEDWNHSLVKEEACGPAPPRPAATGDAPVAPARGAGASEGERRDKAGAPSSSAAESVRPPDTASDSPHGPPNINNGQTCYIIESLPKNETVKSNSGYGKRTTWIRKDNFVMIRGEVLDQSLQPLKTFNFTDVQLVDPVRGKWQQMRLEAANIQTGHRTVIQFDNFKANQNIKDDFFTTRYMEREP